MQNQTSFYARIRFLVPTLLVLSTFGVGVLAGGITYVSELEKQDDFCGSCHTEPETTFLARFALARQQEDAPDLASYHHRRAQPIASDMPTRSLPILPQGVRWRVGDAPSHKMPILPQGVRWRVGASSPLPENMRCIDCHVGEGLLGRAMVLSLAAYDALKYYTGTATQPAKMTFTMQNEACLKCHEQEVKKFLDRPERPFIIDNHFHYKLFVPGAPPLSCVSCHPSHREGSHLNQYQFRRVTVPVCEECHRQVGHGPVKMQ